MQAPDPLNRQRRSVTQFGAAGLALAGYTFWVLADTNLKIAGSSSLPAYEVIGFVGLMEALMLLLYGTVRRRFDQLRPHDIKRQLLRSCLDLFNNLCVVVALRHLPLALFYILVFFAPVVTTVLSGVLLREALPWKKTAAILAGFVGVLVAVDPLHLGRSGDWIGIGACMVCVAAFSANMVWARVLTQTEPPLSLTLVSGTVAAVVGALCLFHHADALPLRFAGVLSLTALFCIAGSTCFFVALKHAPAANVSQFHYSQLLTGALLAYLLWGETLTVWMLAGAVLIIGSGAYTAAMSYRTDAQDRMPKLPAPSEALES